MIYCPVALSTRLLQSATGTILTHHKATNQSTMQFVHIPPKGGPTHSLPQLPLAPQKNKVTCTSTWNQKLSCCMHNLRSEFLAEKIWQYWQVVFNTADVSPKTKEAQKRRATLSQSLAMQSTLPVSVSFVQPALFLPVTLYKISTFSSKQMLHIVHLLHKYKKGPKCTF